MSLADELLAKLHDLERQVRLLQRSEVSLSGLGAVAYSGTPTAGQNAYWTGAGTIAGAGTASFVGTVYPVVFVTRTGSAVGLQAIQGLKYTKASAAADGDGPRVVFELNDNSTTTQNIIAGIGAARNGADDSGDLVFQTASGGVVAEAGRFSATGNLTVVGTILTPVLGTPIIASFGSATHTHTNAAGGGLLANYAYISGAPTTDTMTYWVNTGTVAAASFGTADVVILGGAQTLTGRKTFSDGGEFTRASYPVVLVTRTGSAAGLQATFGFKYTKSSASADGDGPRMIFEINDDSTTTQNIVAGIGAARSGADNSADIAFQTAAAGVVSEVARLTTGGDFVVGGTAASARQHVIQTTLGSEVMRLESTATNSDVRESVYQARAATTDATETTLATITIAATTTYLIEVTIVARRTGGTGGTAEDGATYRVVAAVKNVAGTATLIGSAVNLTDYRLESQAAWDATIDVTSNTARVRVTGAANNNVTWHATIRTWQVSS